MLRPLALALFTALAPAVSAQEYFQQHVDYDIYVDLNDRTHEANGQLRLLYTNNSPDTLREVYFHLWPNAYSSDTTAYARQELRNGDTNFHFREPAEEGRIDSLNFQADGLPLTLFGTEHADVKYVRLPQPLPPGQSVRLQTPFRLKIPASFSRLGHVDSSYQMTQWYPKPAVYDAEGWHAMPYLDRGEFYSEFGDYRVTITLPEKYTVAATGMLTGETDQPRYGVKTLTYEAERVHDFAWFADVDFRMLRDTLQLPGRSETIEVSAYFTDYQADLWAESLAYLKRSVRFYSEKVGTYPYPQVTAVQSALSAGGGMEYPMITVIGPVADAKALDEVLAHEVGHNWFYGILATNERDDAWMDEGINSYFEDKYMRQYYGREDDKVVGTLDLDRIGYRYVQRQGKYLPAATTSDSLTGLHYFISTYSVPEMALRTLGEYVSPDTVDALLADYYERWKFRHPGPEDFFAVAAEHLEARWVEWLRRAIYGGEPVSPPLDGYSDGNLDDGFRLGLGIGAKLPGPALFALPLLGYNANDGVLLGAALHNRTLEPRTVEWIVAPMYGLGSKNIGGFAGGRFRWRKPLPGIQQALFSIGTQGFSDFEPTGERFADRDEVYTYARTAARTELQLVHAPIDERESALSLQWINTSVERPEFDDTRFLLDEPQTFRNNFLRLAYRRAATRELTPLAYRVELEFKDRDGERFLDERHLKLSASLEGGYQYEQATFLRYRLFGGYFLDNALRDRATYPATALSLIDNAASDYAYDGLYLGRNDDNFYRQLARRQGGFRAPIDPAFNYGRSNDFLLATNLDIDVPRIPALALYLDAGYYGIRSLNADGATGEFNWVGGVALTALEGRIGLYLPLVADPDTRLLLQSQERFLDRLSFRLSLSDLLPWQWMDGIF